MDGQSAIIFGLIWTSIVARTCALARCTTAGLFRSYPFFVAFATLSLARNFAAATWKIEPYRDFFNRTQWPTAALEAGVVVEAFWLLARHFRKIRGFGWTLLGLIAGISTLSAVVVGVLRANWSGSMSAILLFGMYTHIAFLTAALLSLAFFRQFRFVPIRPNATRHLLVLSFLFATYFAANFYGQVTRWSVWNWLPNLLLNLGATVAFTWWALVMNRAGEKLPFDPPAEMSNEDFEAAEGLHRQSREELRNSSAEAMRKSLGR